MKLSNWILPLVIALILTAVAMVGARSKQAKTATPITCSAPIEGCAFSHQKQRAMLRFSQLPRPMRPFQLTVHIPAARQVYAQFQMQGMEMGAGRYRLTREKTDTFAASINLPICVTGRRDWMLHLNIDGMRYQMPFHSF